MRGTSASLKIEKTSLFAIKRKGRLFALCLATGTCVNAYDTRDSTRAYQDTTLEEAGTILGKSTRRVFFLRDGLTNRSAAEFPSRRFLETFFLYPDSELLSDRPSYPSISHPSSWDAPFCRVSSTSLLLVPVHSIPVISFLNFLVATRTTPTTPFFPISRQEG